MNKKAAIYVLVIGWAILMVIFRLFLFLEPKSEDRIATVGVGQKKYFSAQEGSASRVSSHKAAVKNNQKKNQKLSKAVATSHPKNYSAKKKENEKEPTETTAAAPMDAELSMSDEIHANLGDQKVNSGPANFIPTDDEIQSSIDAQNKTREASDKLIAEHEALANSNSSSVQHMSAAALCPTEQPNHVVPTTQAPPVDLISDVKSHKYIAH